MPSLTASFRFAILLTFSMVASAQLPTDGLQFEQVVSGIVQPTGVVSPGDGSGRLFSISQLGKVHVIEGGALLEEPFLDISDRIRCCGEYGLIGIAFHPDYGSNGRFFIHYSDPDGASVISSFWVSDEDSNRANEDSEEVLLHVPQPTTNHHGGQLQFGPDGMLYIALGDGGVRSAAQNTLTLHGKILRIDVNVPTGYAIPPDNPFVGEPGAREEVWVYGLRNPWRFSFDRKTGDAWIGDVGEKSFEEVNLHPAASPGGENYGWSIFEGQDCSTTIPGVCTSSLFTAPVFTVGYVEDNCSALIGGYRYRGRLYPQLDGLYFFGDFCRRRLTVLQQTENGWEQLAVFEDVGQITSFGEDEDGELYFTDFNSGDGAVVRITAPVPPPELSLLSSTVAAAGSPAATLTLGGDSLVPDTVARWNGSPRPTTFISSTRLLVTLTPDDLAAPSTGIIDVSTPGPGGGLSESFEFEVVDAGEPAPEVFGGGIVDGASYNPALGVAPGSIAAVFGSGLAAQSEPAMIDPLPAILGGSAVLIGDSEAPIYFGSPGQYNIQIPWDALDDDELRVRFGAAVSPAEPLPLVPYSPGLFSTDGSGEGQAAVLISGSGALAAPRGTTPTSRPARAGEFLLLFANGLGAVTNTPPTGSAALPFPLSTTLEQPIVRINGEPVTVVFSGLVPGLVGLYQINVELPSDVQADPAATIDIEIGGVRSRSLTIAIGAP